MKKLEDFAGKFSLSAYYCTALEELDNTWMTPPWTRLDSNIYNGMTFIHENNGSIINKFSHFTPFYFWLFDFVKDKYKGTKRYQIRINADDLDSLDELIVSGEFKRKYKFISDSFSLSDANYDLELLNIRSTFLSWRTSMRRKSNKFPKEIWFLPNGIESFPIN